MIGDLEKLGWPGSKPGAALEALARAAGLLDPQFVTRRNSSRFGEALPLDESPALARRVEAFAESLGIEAEPLHIAYAEIERVIRSGSPLLIRVQSGDESEFIAIVSASGRRVSILSPDGRIHRLKPERVRELLAQQLDAPFASRFDQVLDEAGISKRRRAAVRAALLEEAMKTVHLRDCWLLRLSSGANFASQLSRIGASRQFIWLTVAQLIQYILFIASWWIIGRGALQGRFDSGWVFAWVLLLSTLIPIRLWVTWLQGSLAIRLGALLKQRLLFGALRLDTDKLRKQGSGEILGRVVESTAVEALAATGGFAALSAAIELLTTGFVLGQGAAPLTHVSLLFGWIAVSFVLVWRNHRRRGFWTEARVAMTNDMVERMVGHRTRLAQEARAHWHDGEDELLAAYVNASKSLDKTGVLMMGLMPRGWLLMGLAVSIPQFVSPETSAAQMAISIGGLLLGYQAFGRLSGSLSQASGAIIAWQQVSELFQAGRIDAAPSTEMAGETVLQSPAADEPEKVLEAADLVYRYPGKSEPVLRDCSLEVYSGERVLLEGPSGEGKSTLVSLLAGLRKPEAGLLLLRGLDYHSLGPNGWRRHVATVPQFHENHVLTGTLAFNLLFGRDWPAEPEALEEARKVCEELGLGPLLARMPSGLSQVVGESGWQLSHGERSRLYIARALLQGGEFIILDESFAALDPENLRLALETVLKRSQTLLVVAHP